MCGWRKEWLGFKLFYDELALEADVDINNETSLCCFLAMVITHQYICWGVLQYNKNYVLCVLLFCIQVLLSNMLTSTNAFHLFQISSHSIWQKEVVKNDCGSTIIDDSLVIKASLSIAFAQVTILFASFLNPKKYVFHFQSCKFWYKFNLK